MTVLAGRPERSAATPPRGPAVAWKLVVAAEAPWTGEIYPTRPGRQRLRFSTVETFCSALLAVTDWPIQDLSTETDHSENGRLAGSSRRGHRTRSQRVGENATAKRKFIVAADSPWTGSIYRTNPGLGHLHFGTFEGFLRAVLDITGWPLECGSSRRENPVEAGSDLSPPISRR